MRLLEDAVSRDRVAGRPAPAWPWVPPAGPGRGPSAAVEAATCWAVADSHMPWTIGSSTPAKAAPAREVWIGL